MRVEVLIDELVLHGVDPRWRHAVGDALAARLARALPARGLRAASYDIARIDAGTARGGDASGLGGSLAHAVQRAITSALDGNGA